MIRLFKHSTSYKTKNVSSYPPWLVTVLDKLFLARKFELQVKMDIQELKQYLETNLPCERTEEDTIFFKYELNFQKSTENYTFGLMKLRLTTREDDWGLTIGHLYETPFERVTFLKYKVYPGVGYAIQMNIIYLIGIAISLRQLVPRGQSWEEVVAFLLMLFVGCIGVISTPFSLIDQRRQLQDFFSRKLNTLPEQVADAGIIETGN